MPDSSGWFISSSYFNREAETCLGPRRLQERGEEKRSEGKQVSVSSVPPLLLVST